MWAMVKVVLYRYLRVLVCWIVIPLFSLSVCSFMSFVSLVTMPKLAHATNSKQLVENIKDLEDLTIYSRANTLLRTKLSIAEINKQMKLGVSIDEYDPTSGNRPIILASCGPFADLEVVKYLVDVGADLNVINKVGQNPLECVIDRLNGGGNDQKIFALIKDMVDKHAILVANKKIPNNPLLQILRSPYVNYDIVEYMTRSYNINAPNTMGWNALMTAAFNPNVSVEIIRYLIEQGADINAMSNDRTTALYSAVVSPHSNLKVVKELLYYTKNTNQRYGSEGLTLLLGATMKVAIDPKLVQLLLNHDANPNLLTRYGHGPLYYAVINPKPRFTLIQLLINAGAKISDDVLAVVNGQSLNQQMINFIYHVYHYRRKKHHKK